MAERNKSSLLVLVIRAEYLPPASCDWCGPGIPNRWVGLAGHNRRLAGRCPSINPIHCLAVTVKERNIKFTGVDGCVNVAGIIGSFVRVFGITQSFLARSPRCDVSYYWILRLPALWVSAALLPLVYLVVAAVLFDEGWTNDIRAMVVSSIISLVLGSVTGFFLGTSYGSQRRADAMVGAQEDLK